MPRGALLAFVTLPSDLVSMRLLSSADQPPFRRRGRVPLGALAPRLTARAAWFSVNETFALGSA